MILKFALLAISMSFPYQAIECVAGGGCGSHLCLSKEEIETTMSTCEWRDSYGCYPKFSKCELQADGNCGWTQTPELQSCIEDANSPKH